MEHSICDECAYLRYDEIPQEYYCSKGRVLDEDQDCTDYELDDDFYEEVPMPC